MLRKNKGTVFGFCIKYINPESLSIQSAGWALVLSNVVKMALECCGLVAHELNISSALPLRVWAIEEVGRFNNRWLKLTIT